MKNYIILVVVIFALLGLVYKAVKDDKDDSYPRCVQHCADRGYKKDYCEARCSPEAYEPGSQHHADLSDPQCMSNCKQARRDEAYCIKACTYY